jgi:catechol 2,3-dioxygenase-like lactoylglutathione lyase family enzyme
MVIDHVAILVPDAVEEARNLRDRFGLGAERGDYLALAGTRMHTVWLAPPQYLEFHTIENRATAEETESGRLVLAREAAGARMIGWAVLVDDLDAVSERLGIEVFDYTIQQDDGTLRGWRAVSGPPHLPFFIDYPNNGDRFGRMQRLYERVGHTSAPTHFSQLTISGSELEMQDWLGPHDLPLRFVRGTGGICEARIATVNGEAVIV